MTANPKIFEDKINKINESMTLYGRRSVLLSVFRFITFFLAAGSLIWAIVNKAALFYFVFAVLKFQYPVQQTDCKIFM